MHRAHTGRRARSGLVWSLGALLALSVGLPAPAPAEAPGPGDTLPVETCARRNLPSSSSRQSVRFRRVDRLGAARISQAEILWRRFGEGARALVRFFAPEELRGSQVLLLQDAERAEALVHLPDLAEVRRVSGSGITGAVFGTDFSYEDLERVLGVYAEGASRRLPDADVDGRDVYVLESAPARGEASQYERVVSYVDRRTCVPLRVDLFADEGRLRKVLKVHPKRIERRGTRWLPTLVLMKDVVEETYTELIVDELDLNLELSEALFSEARFGESAAARGDRPGDRP